MNSTENTNFINNFANLCRMVAGEGTVLLKNEQQILPIKSEENISIFGRCQIDYYRSGTGSGGSVCVPYTSNLLEGLRTHKNITINEHLANCYENWVESHPFDNGGGGWAAEPWHQQEMPLSDELVKLASTTSDKAIVVIGRTAGEDQDNADAPGSYLLTDDEKEMLCLVTKHFEQVIVVLNVGNIIDMSWLNSKDYIHPINGVVYAWHGGMEGGYAIADVLVGALTPSGKLTDTIAYSIADYPSTCDYGDPVQNYYKEDIYVGYRYFETFCPEKVQFEFGYGLSYTTFDIHPIKANTLLLDGKKHIEVKVNVKNTGNLFSGKEVVQLYYSAPQGKLGKPSKVLVGFAKTDLLAPGEEQLLTLRASFDQLASYDDSGVTGHKYAYLLEEGDYLFFVGNSVKNNQQITVDELASYSVSQLEVVSQLEQALAPRQNFTRLKPGVKKEDGTYTLSYEEVPTQSASLKQRIEDNLPETLTLTGNQKLQLRDVYDKKTTMEAFISQLTPNELATIVRGEGMCSPLVTPGTASAFGGVSESLYNYGIPVACTADGPSGIRMSNGNKAVQVPIGTLLAATWNPSLIRKLYNFEGEELLQNNVDVLLGPGLNIRRNPLNGRNFEYFSEDPLITGIFATAITMGLYDKGAHATLKHFACNNQEYKRNDVNAIVSERALREIYLKGFEMAVKDGGAKSIMTAYNPINGYWTASNYDLTTTILRKEWGFKGIVMTDWWAKMNDVIEGGSPDIKNTSSMVRAQNDLYMVVNNYGAEVNSHNDNTLASLENNTLLLGELQRCAMNICYFLMDTPAFFRPLNNYQGASCLKSKPIDTQSTLVDLSQSNLFDLSSTLNHKFCVTTPGVYDIIINLMSNNDPVAQTSCNLYLNDEIATTISTGGTLGRWVKQKLCKVELEAGLYEMRFDTLTKDVQFEWIEFIKA